MTKKEFLFNVSIEIIDRKISIESANDSEIITISDKYAKLCGYSGKDYLPFVRTYKQRCKNSITELELKKLLGNFSLEKLEKILKYTINMENEDFDEFICKRKNKRLYRIKFQEITIEIRETELISPFQIEKLELIYNLTLNKKRRKARILRKYSPLGNTIVYIGYRLYKESGFKKEALNDVLIRFPKFVNIPISSLKVKIRQIKNYIEKQNMQNAINELKKNDYLSFREVPHNHLIKVLNKHQIKYDKTFQKKCKEFENYQQDQISYGLIDAYLKFRNVPLEKLEIILKDYKIYTDKNLESRFTKLLEEPTYLNEKIEGNKNEI